MEKEIRAFKLIETVAKTSSPRLREDITQPPAPFHTTPRSRSAAAGDEILFDKFGIAAPAQPPSTRFKAEGSTCRCRRWPISGHGTFAHHAAAPTDRAPCAPRPNASWGTDTTIRILAKSKCTTGRIWTYVRDDRPFSGHAPPAAVYYASTDEASTRRSIWPPSPASCGPTATMASNRCSNRARRCCRDHAHCCFAQQRGLLRTGRHREECPRGQEAGLPDRAGEAVGAWMSC